MMRIEQQLRSLELAPLQDHRGRIRPTEFAVETAEAHIIFYYGLRSIPEPFSLIAEDLDDHFNFPVVDAMEVVNDQFRDGLHALIEGGSFA